MNLSSVQGSWQCCSAAVLTRVTHSARGVNVNCVKLQCSTRRSIDHDLGLYSSSPPSAPLRSWHFIIHARALFKARGNVNSKSLNLFWPIFAPQCTRKTSQEKRVENCSQKKRREKSITTMLFNLDLSKFGQIMYEHYYPCPVPCYRTKEIDRHVERERAGVIIFF